MKSLHRLSRRLTLQLLSGAAVTLSLPSRAAEAVKVGLILTTSGPFASSGALMLKAATLFMQTKASALLGGVPVELVIRDDGGPNPEAAKRLAQELITRDRIQFLGGLQWTPNAAAIAPLTKQAKIPCVVMNAAGAELTRFSPYLVRTSFTLWQSCYHLGRWAAGKGLKTAYTMVTDAGPGHDAENAFIKGFAEAGGNIVGQARFPLQNPNFPIFVQKAKSIDPLPDILFAFHIGGIQTASFMKACAEMDLKRLGIRVMGPGDLTSDEELPNVGAMAEGTTTAHHYSYAADRAANKTFIAAWKNAYGTELRPNYMSVGVWDGMHAICSAIAATAGKVDPEKAMAALSTFRSDASPRGPVSIDPRTRDVIQNIYIRETRVIGGKPENIEIETITNVKDPWKELNPA